MYPPRLPPPARPPSSPAALRVSTRPARSRLSPAPCQITTLRHPASLLAHLRLSLLSTRFPHLRAASRSLAPPLLLLAPLQPLALPRLSSTPSRPRLPRLPRLPPSTFRTPSHRRSPRPLPALSAPLSFIPPGPPKPLRLRPFTRPARALLKRRRLLALHQPSFTLHLRRLPRHHLQHTHTTLSPRRSLRFPARLRSTPQSPPRLLRRRPSTPLA